MVSSWRNKCARTWSSCSCCCCWASAVAAAAVAGATRDCVKRRRPHVRGGGDTVEAGLEACVRACVGGVNMSSRPQPDLVAGSLGRCIHATRTPSSVICPLRLLALQRRETEGKGWCTSEGRGRVRERCEVHTTERHGGSARATPAPGLRCAAHAPVSPLLAAPVRHGCHNNQHSPASPPCRHHVRRCRRPVPGGDVHSRRPHTRACLRAETCSGEARTMPRVIWLPSPARCPCAVRRAWPCGDTGAAPGRPRFRLLRRPARPGAPCLASSKGMQQCSTPPPPPGARPASDGGSTARPRPKTPACVGTCVPRCSLWLSLLPWCLSSATQLFDARRVTVWHQPRPRRPVLLRLVSRHHAGRPGARLLRPPGRPPPL